MAIKSSTFGRVELSGKDAQRFIQHMSSDKPNQYALEAMNRARKVNKKVREGEQFVFPMSNAG